MIRQSERGSIRRLQDLVYQGHVCFLTYLSVLQMSKPFLYFNTFQSSTTHNFS
jgi:hypothetical protein